MARVVRFEIPADNPERAGKFYETVFGWKVTKLDGQQPYWLVDPGPGEGISGGITRRMSPSQSIMNSLEVESIETTIEQVLAAGGRLVAPKMAIPGVGFLAFCADSEGNSFGIVQQDKLAK